MGQEAVKPIPSQLWWTSGALLTGALLGRFSRATAILVAARFLHPEGFGEVVAGLAAYEILRVIGEAGLDTRLIRQIARSPTQAAHLTAETVSLKGKMYALLIASGLAVTLIGISSADWRIFASLAIGSFGIAVMGSAQAVVTARLEPKALLPYQAASGLLYLIIVSGTAAIATTALATAVAVGLADLIGGAIQGAYLRRSGALSALALSPLASDLSALTESWPVGAVATLATTYARLGIGLLAVTGGAAAVAQYGVAYRVVEVFLLASSAVASVAYATTARIEAKGSDGASKVLLQTTLRRTGVPVLALAATLAASAAALRMLVGGNYVDSVPTTRVLAFALPPMFVNGLLTAHLYGRGRYRSVLKIAVINLGVNLGLVLALVPGNGAPAVALAVVGTECANTVLQARAAKLPAHSLPCVIAALSLIAGVLTFLAAIHGW